MFTKLPNYHKVITTWWTCNVWESIRSGALGQLPNLAFIWKWKQTWVKIWPKLGCRHPSQQFTDRLTDLPYSHNHVYFGFVHIHFYLQIKLFRKSCQNMNLQWLLDWLFLPCWPFLLGSHGVSRSKQLHKTQVVIKWSYPLNICSLFKEMIKGPSTLAFLRHSFSYYISGFSWHAYLNHSGSPWMSGSGPVSCSRTPWQELLLLQQSSL